MIVKKGKKQRLSELLELRFIQKLLLKRKMKHLSILAYHSIQPLQNNYPFNPEIISAEPETFRKQMAFVKKYFNVINFKQLHEIYQNNQQLPPNSLIITFDDGYSDNFGTMLPILEEFDLTACVYISTNYINENHVFWFDEVAFILRKIKPQTLSLNQGDFVIEVSSHDREPERKALGYYLQSVTDSKRVELLQELRDITQITMTDEEKSLVKPLSWDQVNQLIESGVEIGSHSKNHGFLDQMSEEQLIDEIVGSKQDIEKNTGRTVYSFSYPNGNFDDRVVSMVRNNYPFAVSYEHKIPSVQIECKHLIPRIHVELDVDFPLFKSNLFLPEIFLR